MPISGYVVPITTLAPLLQRLWWGSNPLPTDLESVAHSIVHQRHVVSVRRGEALLDPKLACLHVSAETTKFNYVGWSLEAISDFLNQF